MLPLKLYFIYPRDKYAYNYFGDIVKFTFGIVSSFDTDAQYRLSEVFSSICALNIPEYEILTVGPALVTEVPNLRSILFDESVKPNWITRKKNLLVENASYENVVILHDYFVFDKNWYNNFLIFDNDWEICSNSQYLINGKRHFTDWVTWDDPMYPRWSALPYDEWSRTQYQYVSGGYYIIKRHVGLEEPLNENMTWGSAEDVEWSLRVRNKYLMKCNGNSIVRHNKVHRDAK